MYINRIQLFLTGLFLYSFLSPDLVNAQHKEENIPSVYTPLVLNLSDDGQKYVRFILWNQVWLENPDLNGSSGFNFRIRRARVLSYAQISPRFMVLTHFGLNSLTTQNMDPIGNRVTNVSSPDGPQLFLHAAWGEFRLSRDNSLSIGAGLHYWNGLSRFNSASTLNFMTLDNHRQAWAQLGLSDQFARHLGIFAKGELGKWKYTFAVNEAILNALGSAPLDELTEGSVTYSGRQVYGKDARTVLTGRIEYQVFDHESSKLPYRVGTYLGSKSVLTVGAGFFSHRNGTVTIANGPIGNDVFHYSFDAFYDVPLGGGALNAYMSWHEFNYGEDFHLGTTYGTGSDLYGQLGYLLPWNTNTGRFMPYIATNIRHLDAFSSEGKVFKSGINWFINGHNAKITLEYQNVLQPSDDTDSNGRKHSLAVQAHVFL